jgi:hypothetical protein
MKDRAIPEDRLAAKFITKKGDLIRVYDPRLPFWRPWLARRRAPQGRATIKLR